MPEACGPRNDGQLPAAGAAAGSGVLLVPSVRAILRSGIVGASPDGRHELPSRIMRRGSQPSATSANVTRDPSVVNLYVAVLSPPPAASGVSNSTTLPGLYAIVPLNAGQPWPSRTKVPFVPN